MRGRWLYLLLFLIAAGPGALLAGWALPGLYVRETGGNFFHVPSRFNVGFVPVDDVTGMVSRVHYSTGDDGFRWDRLFRRVE